MCKDTLGIGVNRPGAFALERAATLGVPAEVVAWDRASEARAAYDARVLDAVAATGPEVVLLLGWMHVLSAAFVARFPQLLNIHPAFLPLDPAAETVTMPPVAAPMNSLGTVMAMVAPVVQVRLILFTLLPEVVAARVVHVSADPLAAVMPNDVAVPTTIVGVVRIVAGFCTPQTAVVFAAMTWQVP